jgi:hypothetical protein
MCIQNKAKVFFQVNVAAKISSGGTAFLIPVSWNVKLGPSKTSSLSNVALHIPFFGGEGSRCACRSLYREYNFPLRNL